MVLYVISLLNSSQTVRTQRVEENALVIEPNKIMSLDFFVT